MLQRRHAVLVADAGFARAAKGHLDRRHVVVVDPAKPRLEPRGDAVRTREVAREDAGGQSEAAVVGAPYRLFFAVKHQHREHRAEDFLANDAHAIAAAGEDRRRDEVSAGHARHLHAPAAERQRRAFGDAAVDVGHHLVGVRTRDQRTDLGRRVHRVAHAQQGAAFQQPRQETLCHATLHEYAGAVGADLALGVEVAHHRGGHRLLDIGVVENQQRRLAAELHRHPLERCRCGLHHFFAGGNRPGQRHLGHVGVCGEQGAGVATPLQHVENARWNPGLQVNFGQLERGHRCQLGGLEDHRVARRQRRRRFPAGDLQRVVPGPYSYAHAQRLAPGVREGVL